MKQLTVLVPNQRGVAAEIASCLAERGVNIEEIDIEGVEDRGIIVLSVDRYDEALRALRDHGFRAITQDVLLVRLEDRPGALAAVAMRLKDAGIDLRSMHILRHHRQSCGLRPRQGRRTAAGCAGGGAPAVRQIREKLCISQLEQPQTLPRIMVPSPHVFPHAPLP